MIKNFTYTGKHPHNATIMHTQKEGEEIKRAPVDIRLIPGESCELPDDNAHIQSLIAQGLLIETEVEKKTKKQSA